MKTVVISPFSRKMRNNEKRNPKDYPFWEDVVKALQSDNIHVIQIGISGEDSIGADVFLKDMPLEKLSKTISECDVWVSVDNFIQHYATRIKNGIVIWGFSSPKIFGYEENINLVKDPNNFRERQFGQWEKLKHDPSVFVTQDIVLNAIRKKINDE